jgi:hypothetical protein
MIPYCGRIAAPTALGLQQHRDPLIVVRQIG